MISGTRDEVATIPNKLQSLDVQQYDTGVNSMRTSKLGTQDSLSEPTHHESGPSVVIGHLNSCGDKLVFLNYAVPYCCLARLVHNMTTTTYNKYNRAN